MQCSTVEEYLHDKPLKLNSVTEKRHEDHIPLTSLLYSSYILFHWKQKRKGEKNGKDDILPDIRCFPPTA